MANEDAVYRDLQKHLDKQPVGYPATKSGAEIRLLQHFFTPDQARLAMYLNYKPRSTELIYEEAKKTGMSIEEMETMLDAMVKNGVIGRSEKDGGRHFFTIPLVVGMYEGQMNRLSPEFLADFDTYTRDRAFGLSFISTELPQMRTIPVGKSIESEHHVATYDQLTSLINETKGPIVVNNCICRDAAHIRGKKCEMTTRMETCIALGDSASNCLSAGQGREITKEEALEIARLNEEDGLVLQPGNAQNPDFICACCGCCCGMLRTQKFLPKPVEFWSTNYYVSVDPEECTGCGTCVERCQVNAVKMDDSLDISIINLDRCIGCGNCVSTCPSGAISLIKKEKDVVPPETTEDLYETIMANKKGTLGKIKIATRLMLKK